MPRPADWDTGSHNYTEDRRGKGREMTLDFRAPDQIMPLANNHRHQATKVDKHARIDGIKRTKQALDELKAMLLSLAQYPPLR